ncbi:MAG: signal recognition particle protein [Thermoplasmata archaeon HGW-Thermoplasmata-1]|nr:MAG: signal recognition particle protein [Thermoplasmata archaeon HGW-Thermoplasmata-1]
MVLEGLGESLRHALKKIANASHVDATLVKEVVRDIQRALIQADINVKMVLDLSKAIEKRALEEKPPAGMSNREHVIKIVYDELVRALGEPRDIPLKKQVIMMVGLYGQGKTTTCGKLANYFKKRGLRPAFIACDVHRPAAYNQLEQIAASLNVPIYGEPGSKDAVRIVKHGLDEFRKKADVVIVDTAGRHKLENDLIDEMKAIFNAAKPDEKLLVMDAAVGQQAGPQAKAFHDAVGLTGVIISKLDGTAKGGGALSAVSTTGAPVVFIGVGEHSSDLEKFDSTRFVSRMLGMGDIQSLLEKAQDAVDMESAEKSARRIMSGKFTLHDLYQQIDMLKGMGSLSKVAEMLPGGMGANLQKANMGDAQKRMGKFKVIMDSMTEEEMNDPSILKAGRIRRIARGSGTEPKNVKELLKYYDMSKGMIKGFSGNRKMKRGLMKQLQFNQ